MPTEVLTGTTVAGATTRPEIFRNFIDGEWVESRPARLSKTSIRPTRATSSASSRNPTKKMWSRRRCGEARLRKMAAGSRAAPRRDPLPCREILIERKEEYARDMTREMGKVIKETRGDVQEAIDCGYYIAGEGRRLFGPTMPSELPNKFAMAVRQPLGVCGMITPWNFPMAIPSWKLFPALVCRQHLRDQAGAGYAALDLNFVQALNDAGIPQGRGEHRHRLRRRSRHAAGRASRRPRGFAHRIDRGRPHRRQDCGQDLQALLARARRQKSDDRAGRRQPRAGPRRRAVGRVRHHRTALHRDQPHHRAEGRVQRSSSTSSWSARRS